MSGSPIMQDGKLMGAVAHVLVNDPTKGMGFLDTYRTRHRRNFDRGTLPLSFLVWCGMMET